MKKKIAAFLAATVLFASAATANAAAWYWLGSTDKYNKLFDPASVKVVREAKSTKGSVATQIEAWTKTTYSYAGAEETIKNYGIADVVPNPAQLAYSLARVSVNPQNRTIRCLQENFYNADNQVIWSRAEGNEKEVNSREFDEDFYTAIVDEVFRLGETARRKAEDRWITLYEEENAAGDKTVLKADTTTMRMKDTNLVLWEWYEHKTASGQTEIKFMKKSVNLEAGTEKVLSGKYWSATTRWQDLYDDMDGKYRPIGETSPDYKGLMRLRAFAKGYSTWVNRYSLK